MAWIIGHLVISERSALGRVGMKDLPPLPEGFEKRFARDAETAQAQSFGDVATRSGALERARKALTASGADIAFGLEGGVELDGERVWLLSWVAAIDPAGREGYASGLRMLLPPSLGAGLRAGVELGTLVDALFEVHDSKSASGAIGLLTDGAVSRTDAFADLVAMSLAPWIHPDHYR